ncbi:MAG: dihydroorotase [Marinobacter sp.]|nr:dihydroorotase [Marinobacter sp.]
MTSNNNMFETSKTDQKVVDLVIRNGEILTPSGRQQGDIACHEGAVVAVGETGWRGRQEIDARGLTVLPGVMDTQVHFREPGLTHKETLEAGTRGAVLGGVTTIFEMPNTSPLTITREALASKLEIAARYAWCDYGFYIGGCRANIPELAELELLPGCVGIKVFMGSSFGDLLADQDDVLREIVACGHRRMAIHAEDEARLRARRELVERSRAVTDHPHWRDVETALNATKRILAVSETVQRRLHLLHISTAEELELLAAHRHRVSVEVLPHHLTLTAPECYERLGTLAQMNPPVRGRRHQDALWRAVRNGLVDVLGSDHAPHTLEEKAAPYPDSPSGMPGTQTLLPVMLDHVNAGRLSLERLVDLTSAGPARVFGIARKGRVAKGYDADFTLVDLKQRREIERRWIASVSGWSPYEGMEVCGWPMMTVIRGQVVMRDDEVLGTPGGRPVQFAETLRPQPER